MIKKIVFLLLYFSGFWGYSQNLPRPEINVSDFVNKIASMQSTDIDYEKLYENIYSLYQNPIDLNRSEIEDLRSLFFLTELQINSLISHRQKFGYFLSLYELQSVPNLDIETIRNILPFVIVSEKYDISSIKRSRNAITEHYLVLRADQTLQASKGFLDKKYVGSRQRYYTRYRLSHVKDFNIGFVTEKDPGEKNFLDYSNFHFQVQNKRNLKNLIIGDYQLQFGQGLILAAGFAPGKGSETVYTTRRSNLGIKSYNSVTENNSFRGIASSYQFKKIIYTVMASRSKKDASLDTDLEEFGSLLTSGYHRTTSEIANKNAVKQYDFGGNATLKVENLQVGFTAISTVFDNTFQKRDALYNAFEFTGKRNLTLGPNVSFSWQNFNFFGEAARSSSGGIGFVGGFVGSISQKTEWALNFRNYQKNFNSFYASSFSEGSRSMNEKGIYTGIKYSFTKKLVLSAYYDYFKFPWLKYRVDMPSYGNEYQIGLNYKKTKTHNFYISFHHESKLINQNITGLETYQLAETNRNNFIISNDFLLHRKLRFQTKLALNNYKIGFLNASKGFAIIQDVETKFTKIKINLRAAYFKTDSYDSRVYAYENDVLYAVSFPAYFGNGIRAYVIGQFPITQNLSLALRIAHSYYLNQTSIGSGNDLINGNQKTDVRIQLKYDL